MMKIDKIYCPTSTFSGLNFRKMARDEFYLPQESQHHIADNDTHTWMSLKFIKMEWDVSLPGRE